MYLMDLIGLRNHINDESGLLQYTTQLYQPSIFVIFLLYIIIFLAVYGYE